ncbi:class I poly(R)-hydroxyalkanoic acid synthase [Alcaligenaceae bacterium CGII-47]|nr:class I poly(R)-hydroxyalkanoic acid synthase [Alcaligenaceae bacterium CGII-47]
MAADNQFRGPMPLAVPPERLASIQADFSERWRQLLDDAQRGTLAALTDRRFSSAAWQHSPTSLMAAHAYLIGAHTLEQMVDAADMDEFARKRLRFTVMQWIEAASPSNFWASNPDAHQALTESGGQALQQGMANLLQDISQGRITQTDDTEFELGKNLATTPGDVIYENRLMQLIRYRAQTAHVHERPLLLVPPCINKFYILDLQPENSFVRHAVEQGFSVFLISWRNPLETDTDGIDQAGWTDYLDEGILQAIEVVRELSGQPQINALGFCVGGTMLATALALAHARGEDPVAALSLLTTFLDFSETGILDVFVDEMHAQSRDRQFAAGGLMTARELGTTFSFLRPSELVWNYVSSNYMQGKTPRAFDLLAWNADGTNLPGPFFAWYFRNTYLENNLRQAGKVHIDGHPIDLGALSMPTYLYGSRDDHIVPWTSAYASTGLLSGASRFVLGESGHIAGVINPPSKNRRSYWAHDENSENQTAPHSAQAWLDGAARHPGSWWPDWSTWLSQYSGKLVRVRKPSSRRYKTIEPAPGRYVKIRAV